MKSYSLYSYLIIMKTATKLIYCEKDYYFINTVKEKKQELEKRIEKTKKEIELLKSVKIVTKKDWSEFKNFLQNFSCDWKIYKREYPFEDQVTISNYPIEIDIKFTCNDKDIVEKIRKDNPERVYSHSRRKDFIIFTVKEFYEEIQKEIERLENYLNKLEKRFNNFDNDLNKIIDPLENLLNTLIEIKSNWYENYDFKEIVEKTVKHFY